MSREIKFRQWIGRRFRYWGFIGDGKAASFSSPVDQDIKSGQFTGLLDKEGKEIYEGDIAIWYVNNIERKGEIYYDDQAFSMRSTEFGYIGFDALRGEIEVIGNIYENPELLAKD